MSTNTGVISWDPQDRLGPPELRWPIVGQLFVHLVVKLGLILNVNQLPQGDKVFVNLGVKESLHKRRGLIGLGRLIPTNENPLVQKLHDGSLFRLFRLRL